MMQNVEGRIDGFKIVFLNTFLDLKHTAIKSLLCFYSFILLNGYREAAGDYNLT